MDENGRKWTKLQNDEIGRKWPKMAEIEDPRNQ